MCFSHERLAEHGAVHRITMARYLTRDKIQFGSPAAYNRFSASGAIRRRPSGGVHGAHQVGLGAFEADVDYVAADAERGDRARAEARNLLLALVVAPGERRGR